MSRSWKQERTAPKNTPVRAPRPRMSDFAKDLYQSKGYMVCCEGGPMEAGCMHDHCTGPSTVTAS